MKKTLLFILLITAFSNIRAQNTGIGTITPQRKLHVAGGVRIDTLAGAGDGLLKFNNDGDLIRFPQSGNIADVLRGDGSWGAAGSTSLPTGTIVGTPLYNNPALISIGYSLVGELPLTAYYNYINETISQFRWVPTYVKGLATKRFSPPSGYSPQPVAWGPGVMYVLSGGSFESYDPIADEWAQVSINTIGIAGHLGRKAVWTGSQFITWGGHFMFPIDNGVVYTLATNTWSAISTVNQPSARINFTMIWAANKLMIWGGEDAGGNVLNDGALYDPATNTWTAVNTSGAPSARRLHTAVWANQINRIIVWGGSNSVTSGADNQLNDGASFNPITNTWTGITSATGAPSARYRHTAVWTSTEMIIYGGLDDATALNSGAKYNPAGAGTWTAISTTNGPLPTYDHAASWVGPTMVVTGGVNGDAGPSASYYVYDAGTNQWITSGNYTDYNDKKYNHHSFYTGNMVIIWGGYNGNVVGTNTGYRYFLADIVSSASFNVPDETMYLYQKD